MAQMTPLRRRMIDNMTGRNLSPSNPTILRLWGAKFSRFFGFSLDPLYYFSGGTRAGSKPSPSWRD